MDVLDSKLFQNPADLVCPLTLSLFKDPVINGLGQVYERAAIEEHFQQKAKAKCRAVDPITNVPLESLQLTPVYPMRSRALEYREQTGKACVEAACHRSCSEPIMYIRRAVELCSEVNIRIPGQALKKQLLLSLCRRNACSCMHTQAWYLTCQQLCCHANNLILPG